MITFDSVTKTFPNGTVAISDLSLEIPDESVTVFVGPSGCGKTTSMRMINKMVEPTSGTVSVNGEDISQVAPVQLRLGIGYVIQHAGLFPHKTVLDNVAQVLRLKGVPKKEARRQADIATQQVRLHRELVHRYPSELSGGQQQRVGVARALAADPPILLMDEPFSAVDPIVREELQDEMLRIQRELKKTIVFVTHDIDEALRLGDQVAVFAPGGTVDQYASPETVLTQPATSHVAEMVGHDRGVRALSFVESRGIDVHRFGEPDSRGSEEREYAVGNWRILTDAAGVPKAWKDAHGREFPLGSSTPLNGSMRQVLNAVLSAPGEYAAVVDERDVLVGAVRTRDVFCEIEAQKTQS
jgi:osmoprotectant transport system ATP-binding protein